VLDLVGGTRRRSDRHLSATIFTAVGKAWPVRSARAMVSIIRQHLFYPDDSLALYASNTGAAHAVATP
jgi:hypothetical protein